MYKKQTCFATCLTNLPLTKPLIEVQLASRVMS